MVSRHRGSRYPLIGRPTKLCGVAYRMSWTMVGSTSDRSTKPGGACESTLVTGDGLVGVGVAPVVVDGGADGGGVPVEHAVSAAHAASSAAATRTRCTWPVYHREHPKIPATVHKLGVRARKTPQY